jgi:type II restriction enzyme
VDLLCNPAIASAYKSPGQRARVISEQWFSENSYCLACESDRLIKTPANTRATDFLCKNCGHCYELKTFIQRPRKSLVDGAYASLLAMIESGTAPTLCLLERNEFWQVRSLTAIHASFLTPWVIERRAPLAQHARRAGWVGCNIRLDRIPPDAEIELIDKGFAADKVEVRRRFERFLPLSHLSAEQRGWSTLTLSVIRKMGKSGFVLSDLYDCERQFAAAYPRNRNIQPKIRQQLQVLRDLGVISFEGGGHYSLLI